MLLTDPITLENEWVRLEPLSPVHAEDLAAATAGLEQYDGSGTRA